MGENDINIKSVWNTYYLSDVAETTSGGTPDRKNKNFYQGQIPWVKSGELKDNFLYDTEEKITKEALKKSSAKLFPSGTLLIAMYGATVGKTSILKIPAATNQAVCGIFPDSSKINVEFLRYQLIYDRPEILKQRYGGAQPNISQTIIRNHIIKLPELIEQQKIAFILSTVQRAIEQQERLIQVTTELKKALMHKLFTEGTRGEPQKQTEIGLVPESWEVQSLDEMLTRTQYGLSVRGENSGDYGIMRMTNQVEGKIETNKMQFVNVSKNDLEKYKLKRGDILFNRTNSLELVGRTAIFDIEGEYVFASYLIRLNTDVKQLNPFFLNHYLNWDESQRRLKSIALRAVSQSNISATRLRTFQVPIPSLQEQIEINVCIDRVIEKIKIHQHKKKMLLELFRTLIHQLMTAQIRVHEIEFEGLEE